MKGVELVKFLNQCEIMVISSAWREPFDIVALEPLECGFVLLVANSGGVPEAIGPAILTFKRGSIEVLKNNLFTLKCNPSLRAALKSQANWHLNRFTAQVVFQKCLSEMTKVTQSTCPKSLL